MMLCRYMAGLALVGSLAGVGAVHAQPPISPIAHASTSASAAQLLAQVQQSLRHAPVVRGNFTQEKTIPGFKQALRSSGVFVVSKADGMVWQVQQPFASMLRVTPERLQSIQADGSLGFELQAQQEPGLRAINAMLFAVMSADTQTLMEHFEVTAGSPNPKGWSLLLTPRDAMLRQWLSTVQLQGDSSVRYVRLQEAQGQESVIALQHVSLAQTLSAADAQLFK